MKNSATAWYVVCVLCLISGFAQIGGCSANMAKEAYEQGYKDGRHEGYRQGLRDKECR